MTASGSWILVDGRRLVERLLPCLLVAGLSAEVCGAERDGAFASWLATVREEALAQGVSAATADAALAGLAPLQRVLELQRRQPEAKLSLEQYLSRLVPDSRVERGAEVLSRRRELLEAIAQKYGVQPRFIVALWGLESDYGQNMGTVPAVASLATLAYAGRRRAYFRAELLELLKLLDAEQLDPARALGSWAGALGQCQFMPSNVRRHAVDWDGDGRRDIWGSTADVLASTANLLSRLGWRDDETWGRRVRLPPDFDERLAGRNVRMKISRWQALGVRRMNGSDLPTRELWSSLLLPDGRVGRAYLVYEDFNTLLKWNNSIHFALSVGHLSERLR